MRWHLGLALVLSVAAAGTARAEQGWMFNPGHYSHDPATGARVAQYRPPAPAYVPQDPTYLQSGYRHKRSRLNAGGSGDFRHIVETWGEGELIRPYGEWLFPYRAGATPYGPWGNPQGPWTLPFDSWVNPYGGSGGYYPNPYPYGNQWHRWGPGPYPPFRQGAGSHERGAYPHGPGYAGGYPGGYPGGPGGYPGGYPGGPSGYPGGPGGHPGGYPGGAPGGPGGHPGGHPPPHP